MITPRRTRLIRVPDLHEFRRTIAALCAAGETLAPPSDGPEPPPSRVLVVPTRGAAATLARTLVGRQQDARPARDAASPQVDAAGPTGTVSSPARDSVPGWALVTRDELYDVLYARLSESPRRLSSFERDAIAQSAAIEAAALTGDLPFKVRPGLVAEILRFYDQLRRQSQMVKRFEELITDALGGDDTDDSGARRLLRQTRFLAETFRGYERRADAVDAVDEHRLRERLLADHAALPLAQVIVTVPDWIADPAGLFVADFDLLNRLPNLASIDIVSTEGVLASGFHERLHTWWPGIDEVTARELTGAAATVRPMLVVPQPSADAAPLWFTHRDREEELIAIARRVSGTGAAPTPDKAAGIVPPDEDRSAALDRTAVVFKRPLPYLYLAADTLGAAGVPYVVSDALPLAAEPSVAAVDLVLDALESNFAREPLVALLRSPHLDGAGQLAASAVSAFDRALSEARYLGGLDRLRTLLERGPDGPGGASPFPTAAVAPLERAIAWVEELSAIDAPRPASVQIGGLLSFLEHHLAPLDPAHPLFDREARARQAVLGMLREVASAHAAHHDPPWTIADLASGVRRWIGDETFVHERASHGVRLLDDEAARYGAFDDITIVGLIENEWPDRSRRNIFYAPNLLKALNWPSEKDRRAAADARFIDLLASATARVELSTFLLDDEAIVSRSIQLDEVPRARLSTVARAEITEPLLGDETLALHGVVAENAGSREESREWLQLRIGRTPGDDPAFHGSTGARPSRTWSVSALETYITCPFKFFAQHVLKLEEEPDDEEVMDPRRQGQFVHEVFQSFFEEWQREGHAAMTSGNLPIARELFKVVVDRALERVPEGEAELERTRLLGSPAAAGLGEAVFRMEAERPIPVVTRLLEHTLNGAVTIQTESGPRTVHLRGKADRLDLLADGTFRLIDYKLGWPPDRGKALQLPIYALSAEQHLDALNRRWTLGEAVYLAFKGPKRVVPLFSTESARAETLARAQQRLADTIDAIERGEFPPSPEDVFRCEMCSFSAVCRKDYVGDL